MIDLLLAQANGNQPRGMIMFVVVAIVVIFSLIFVAIFFRFISLYIQCWMTGAGISLPHLVMMTIRKVNPAVIVRAKIIAVQAGLTEVYQLSTRDLESHYLAGGNVP